MKREPDKLVIPGLGMAYTVSQKDGIWYAHMVGYSYIPVFGSFGTRREAMEWAAASMGLGYRDYITVRSKYRIK
jgi:hypothetical protein